VKKIGIFSIKEDFANSLIHKINQMNVKDIRAEFALVGDTKLFERSPYCLIIDRLSYYVNYFSAYFKNAALMGTYIINNPFAQVGERFLNYHHAKKMGVHVPRTVCLPSRLQHPACSTEDLRNLKYPLDWEELTDFVGFPAVLKPYEAFGYRDVYKVNSIDELIQAYNSTGKQVMILQQFIDYDLFVKIYVVGGEVLVVKYKPSTREHITDDEWDKSLPGQKIIDSAKEFSKKMGFDFGAMEYAIKDGAPYAVNFINPSPNCRKETLGEENFDWLVEKLSTLAINLAVIDAKNNLKC